MSFEEDFINAVIEDCNNTLIKYDKEFNPEYIVYGEINCYCKENLNYVIRGCKEEGFTFAYKHAEITRRNNKMASKCNHIWEETSMNKVTSSS